LVTTSPSPWPPIRPAITTSESANMIVWFTDSSNWRRASGSWTLKSVWSAVDPNAWAASTESLVTPRMPSAVMRTAGGIA
jgi:hypothetical protein